MKVTVGRIVHFYPRFLHEVVPAVVTQVNGTGTVSLWVMYPSGMSQAYHEVGMASDPTVGFWSWPPREG